MFNVTRVNSFVRNFIRNVSKSTIEMPPKRGRKSKAPIVEKSSSLQLKKEPTPDDNSDTSVKEEELPPPVKRARKNVTKDSVKEVKTETQKENGKDSEKAPAKRGKQQKVKDESEEGSNDNSGGEESDESKSKKIKEEEKGKKTEKMNKTDSDLGSITYGCDKANAEGEKHNLKICSWNVAGIRALIKKNGMDYIAKEDADIFTLQEVKCNTDKLPSEVKVAKYHRYFLDSKKPGYCGMALYSKTEPINVKFGLPNSKCNDEGRLITAEYEKFYLVSAYVPNAGNKLVTLPKRLQWNEDFKKHILDLDKKKPVIVCGDMNVAHQEIDLKNPKTNTKNAGFTKEERDGMTEFLNSGFVDSFRMLYPDKIDAYTFWAYFGNARSRNVGWRLDYFIVSERISKKVCDNVIRDKVYGSDHCPVVLYINI